MIDRAVENCYNIKDNTTYVGGVLMDRITENFLKEFSKNFDFEKLDICGQFEYFADYCAIANETNTVDIDLQDMSTGDSTQGIDGIAIEINGRYIQHISEIDDIIKYNKSINVTFVLVQAKTSEEFNNTLIGNFLNFVKIFFSDNTIVFKTDEMKNLIELKNYIFSKSSYMKSRNPNVKLYYVSCGTWNESDTTLNAVISRYKKDLLDTNLFADVSFIPLGSKDIQNAYRKSTNDIEASFMFERRVTMFSNGGSDIAYCGVLPYKEFKKIICSSNGNLNDVFEDNIRDFLGDNNDVNSSIQQTLQSDHIQIFSVLNNGITIVADSINITGDKATITNYQIVNGCQTSHVIFDNENIEGIDDLMIPIRLIATTNEDLKNDITRATNNQTSIKKEQLEALSTFQRTLEEYYKTYSDSDTVLYYERRTGQYRNKGICPAQVISIPMQIKAASSMFLNNPHGVSGQYGTIAKNAGKKLFRENDKPILYYVSALAVYRLESFIKQKKIDKKYRKARYHAIMLFKYVVAGKDMPKQLNCKKMEEYCEKIFEVLSDEKKSIHIFKCILQFIENLKTIDYDDRKVFEKKETTDILLGEIDNIIEFVDSHKISD